MTKRYKKRYGLLPAWINHISHHHCPTGLRALRFLKTCIAKGIVEDREVWRAASSEIKQGLRTQVPYRLSYRLRDNPKLVPRGRIIVYQPDLYYPAEVVSKFSA